jgi:serine/threonine-protein kinase
MTAHTQATSTIASVTVLGRLWATRAVWVFLVLVIATPVTVGWTAYRAYERSELPDIGLDIDSQLGVESHDARWGGVHQRDRVVAVDGVAVRDPADFIARALAHEGELAVTFDHDGQLTTLLARSRPLAWIDRGAIWARVATSLALMMMGLFVFVARPGTALTWLMMGLAWDLGLFLLVKIGFWPDPALVKVANIYPWLFATAVGLHFLCYFPQRVDWLRGKPRRALWFYLPVVVAPIVHIAGAETSASKVGTAWAAASAMAVIVVIGVQYRSVRRSNDVRSKSQYRALFVGLTAGLVVPGVWNWLRIALDVWNSPWAAYYNALPLVLFIGVTSYAVVRHNALAIDRFTAAIVGYGVTIFLLGGAFAAVLVGMPLLLGGGIGESPGVLVLTTALTFASFAPLYRVLKRRLDRRFFRESTDATQIADALRKLVLDLQQGSRDDVIAAALDATAILHADRVEVWLLAPEGKQLVLARQLGASREAAAIDVAEPLGKALASGISAGVQELAPRAVESAAQEALWARELAMVAPVMVRGVVAGMVGVGRKRSGAGYTIEELSFLTIVGAQLAAGLERTRAEIQLDRYHLERRIGTGGMAEVYLAWQVGAGGFERTVALKRPLPHVSEDPNAVASFLDEARLAAQLVHPSIAQAYDVGEQAGSYYIVMEYVDGPSLRQVLRGMKQHGKKMPPAIAVAIGGAVLSALDYAHRVRDEKGRALELVHRDVSPRNILMNRAGQPKLVDFGIARAQFQLHVTRTGIVKGTLPYMSPEQATDRDLDHRSDQYSAAVVVYELLTGETMFPKGPGTRRPKPLAEAQLDRVIRKATDAAAEDRYDHAALFAEALVAAIAPAQPAEPEQIADFLCQVCPELMDETAPIPADITEASPAAPPEPEPEATGERTAVERRRDDAS